MKKVLLVFGTRPEAIKMYPVYKSLKKNPHIDTKIAITSQHQEMLKQVINLFDMYADYNLNVMEDRQTLTKITVKVLERLKTVLEREKPDIVLVHGDTTTTFSASLAAFYEKISVGHVEAGLRTYKKYLPYPEEINRELTDRISDLLFAPTELAKKNLLSEGISEENVFVTGNTVVDAVNEIVRRMEYKKKTVKLPKRPFIIVTAHRRENWGKPMENICKAIDRLSEKYGDSIKFVFSVHKNPIVRDTVKKILDSNRNVNLIEPLEYNEFLYLLSKSLLILTDSGGIQEEAPSLGKPVLLLRDVTERPEAVNAGAVKIVGTDTEKIVAETENLLDNENEYEKMAKAVNPFGDGKAGERIAGIVEDFLLKGDK